MKKITIIACLLLIAFLESSLGQIKTSVKEYDKVFKTYPFSDPDPIPEIGKVYPYFRFDGYATQAVDKKWKVVELENDFIKIMILPEIGGKIWTAIEKSTGRSFIYNNSVIKFRDVAMRGPWTSGGIEANYGIIGHTPNVATPVDYKIINRNDGSVSCVIGVLDLLTRTSWRMDINLAKDKAYFTTNSFWYNASSIEQPYYSWMNAGIKADGNLQFIFPGTKHIGHNGEYSTWPMEDKTGRDLSFYKNNNFGGPKSYHIFGKHTDFYGNFWHDDNFGMGRYSSRDDKPGMKVWIWGLSRQGMIWENLLTDTDGQYVEVQSGRLFNQESEGSTFTPFKHRAFAPHAADLWSESWFPVVGTKGLVAANNYAALNVKQENGWIKIYLSPLQPVDEQFKITVNNRNVYVKKLKLSTLQLFTDSIRVTDAADSVIAVLGENKLVYNSSPSADVLSRPSASPEGFDWKSVYGMYVEGKELMKQRFYTRAEEKLRECLAKDPNYAPALTDLSILLFRRMQYIEALELSKKALSINTYDPAANYYYGLINLKMGNITDAKDGFEIAASAPEYRTPAYTALSGLYLKQSDFIRSIDYAKKGISTNKYAIDSYQQLAVSYRALHKKQEAGRILDSLLSFDPLNHFARFEKYLWKSTNESKEDFVGLIRNEMPHETFLELAIWYYNNGSTDDAIKVLNLSPKHTMVSYWLAFLRNNSLLVTDIKTDFVFPFRPESAEVLNELIIKNEAWQLKYHLALLHWNLNNMDKVKALFEQIGDMPSYAPYYASRAKLKKSDPGYNALEVLTDLKKAAQLDKNQWRYGESLINYYFSQNQLKEALLTSTQYQKNFKSNYILSFLKAKALILNKNYAEAKVILKGTEILPNEGATQGRELYKETLLSLAIAEMNKGNYKKALQEISESRLWPENLGVGKPYQADIDERLEDWLAYQNYIKIGNNNEAQKMLQKIIAYDYRNKNNSIRSSANNLITALALRKSGKSAEAEKFLENWLKQDNKNAVSNWAFKTYKGEDTSKAAVSTDVNYRVLKEIASTGFLI